VWYRERKSRYFVVLVTVFNVSFAIVIQCNIIGYRIRVNNASLKF
jgi:hypothetical protein